MLTPPVACSSPSIFSSRISLTSLRARLGYLVTPDIQAYATAGGAWQSVQAAAACQHTFSDPICLGNAFTGPLDTQTHNKILPGWTVGAGLEAKIYGNLLLRGEYRFAQYSGNDSLVFAIPGLITTVNTNLRIATHLATVGLAYKFGGL
jgi:outer membrane immunogenic protein